MNLLLIVCFVLSFRIFCLYSVVTKTVRGAKIKVYAQAFGFSVGRDLYHATPDVAKAVGFALSYKRPPDTLLLLQQVVLSTFS